MIGGGDVCCVLRGLIDAAGDRASDNLLAAADACIDDLEGPVTPDQMMACLQAVPEMVATIKGGWQDNIDREASMN